MKNYEITDIHEEIVKVLLRLLRNKGKKVKSAGVITYGDLCARIEHKASPRTVAGYLGDISCWCHEIGAPMLSVMVINKEKNHPGKGFFTLYGDLYEMNVKKGHEDMVFISELNKVHRYKEWERLEAYLGI